MPPNIASVFAALGDETRLIIVSKLQDGSEQSISKLTEGLSLTRQGVSRHLNVLETAGILKCQRIGREARYSLEVATLSRAQNYLQQASKQWDEAIVRLRQHLGS